MTKLCVCCVLDYLILCHLTWARIAFYVLLPTGVFFYYAITSDRGIVDETIATLEEAVESRKLPLATIDKENAVNLEVQLDYILTDV